MVEERGRSRRKRESVCVCLSLIIIVTDYLRNNDKLLYFFHTQSSLIQVPGDW